MANPVIAVVSDIRGFTDFTSTVDSVNRSDQVAPGVKKRLLEHYDRVVEHTQRAAIQHILGPLARALQQTDSGLRKAWVNHGGKVIPLPCALKSTGDGFLVAVELVHNGIPVEVELQSALAKALTDGLTNLVSAAKEGGEFRKQLEGFFAIWQDYLALRLEANTFRVAGALALGTGQVSDKEDVPKKWKSAQFLNKVVKDAPSVLALKSDAYGHGVNLAFRLCDRAGREDRKGADGAGPYVLLDRRIGQLLIEPVPETENKDGWVRVQWDAELQQPFKLRVPDRYALARFPFNEPLKGIDEMWCYSFDELIPEGITAREPGANAGE